MFIKKRSFQYILLLSAMLLVVGCGPSRPETATITGTVTYQGKPLDDARVSFYPSKGRPANGMTDSQGHFSLTTFEVGDGAMLGEHNVAIAKQKMLSAPTAQNPRGTMKYYIPQRYADPKTSGLTAKVDRGDNNFTFDLTD